MRRIVFYIELTGEIINVVDYLDETADGDITADQPDGCIWVEGDADPDADYVLDGVVTERPDFGAEDEYVIAANGVKNTLFALPDASAVTYRGQVRIAGNAFVAVDGDEEDGAVLAAGDNYLSFGMDDPAFQFQATRAGEFKFKLEPDWPYQPTVVTINSVLVDAPAAIPLPGKLKGVAFTGHETVSGPQWPRAEAADYYMTQKRMNAVRLCLRWELLQPELGGDLDAGEVAGAWDQIDRITALGGTVIIDIHNFGRRRVGGIDYLIGEVPQVTQDHFVDLWQRIVGEFGGVENIVWELMNEPHGADSNVLVDYLNAATLAIRGAGSGHLIVVPGNDWSNSFGWVHGPSHNMVKMLDIVDPSDNYAYQLHHYFDTSSQGTGTGTDATWDDNLQACMDWAAANVRRFFISEFALPYATGRQSIMDQFFDIVDVDQVLGWTYWHGGGWVPYAEIHRLDPYGSKFDGGNPYASRATTWAEPLPTSYQMEFLRDQLADDGLVNVLAKSRDFGATPYARNGGTNSADAIDSPFGPLTGSQLIETAATSQHGYQANNSSFVDGDNIVYAIIKKGSRSRFTLSAFNAAATLGFSSVFDLDAKTVLTSFATGIGPTGTPLAPIDMGDGWLLLGQTFDLGSAMPDGIVSMRNRDPSVGETYLGTAATVAFSLCHVQLAPIAALQQPRHVF